MINSDQRTPRQSPSQISVRRSLKIRFIFFVTILTFITMSLVAVFSINRERRIIIENVLQKTNLAARTIAKVASGIDPANIEEVRGLCAIITGDADIFSIYIKKIGGFFDVSRKNSILLTVSSRAAENIAQDEPENNEVLLLDDIFQMKYYFRLGNSFKLYRSFCFKDGSNGEVWLNVLLVSTQSEINLMLRQHIILTAFVTFFGGLISLIMTQFVLTPLNFLIKSTLDIAEGIYGSRVPVTGSDEVSYFSSVFNEMLDHLEQKEEFERRMQNLDKLVTVGQLAAGIAHEIKNPLTSIRSLVEILKDDVSGDDEKSKVIKVILAEVDRLNKVTNEFVSLSRPKTHGKYSFFDINIVIRNTIMLMGPQLKKNDVQVFTNMNAKIHIYGDHDEMAQVFLNLILNSMQALETKKQNRNIIINTSDAPDHSYIEIIDNGCGIAAENVPKVFMPFFTDKKTGTGLGLSIVKRILDDMKAEVLIESEQGAGTAFKIRVPIKSDYSKSNY